MKVSIFKKNGIKRKWHLLDAKERILGRLASEIVLLLIGKHKENYVPYRDEGDYVVVINAKDIKVTKDKKEQKKYYHYSGYPGGLKFIEFKKIIENEPEQVILRAVKGMLPDNRLKKGRLKRLKIYKTAEHPHEAQIKLDS